jgi:hypothetical protein
MHTRLFNLGQGGQAAHANQCPLCHSDDPLDVYHLVAECTYPAVDAWRKSCMRSLRDMVLKLTSVLAEERGRAGRLGLSIFDRAATAVRIPTLTLLRAIFCCSGVSLLTRGLNA